MVSSGEPVAIPGAWRLKQLEAEENRLHKDEGVAGDRGEGRENFLLNKSNGGSDGFRRCPNRCLETRVLEQAGEASAAGFSCSFAAWCTSIANNMAWPVLTMGHSCQHGALASGGRDVPGSCLFGPSTPIQARSQLVFSDQLGQYSFSMAGRLDVIHRLNDQSVWRNQKCRADDPLNGLAIVHLCAVGAVGLDRL